MQPFQFIMKTSHNLLYLTLFFVYTIPLPCAAVEQPSPVLDTERNIVRTGVDYYVLPVVRGRGGGLTLAPAGNKTCPLSVVQERLEVDNGLPLTFRPADATKDAFRVSTDHNIKFSAASACAQSTVWMLERDEASGEYLITTGGVEGNPGRETVSNWFKIEEYEGDYKLVFCPTVCDYCKVICRDVGVVVRDGKRILGLTDGGGAGASFPFRVMFKKTS